MIMTHYMELLAVNQPWNLLLFMAVPVILAETVAITELYLLYTRAYGGAVHRINKLAGLVAGLYFTGVFVYLLQGALTASLWDRMVWAGLSMAFLGTLWPKSRRREACDGIDPVHSATMHEQLDREEALEAERARLAEPTPTRR